MIDSTINLVKLTIYMREKNTCLISSKIYYLYEKKKYTSTIL